MQIFGVLHKGLLRLLSFLLHSLHSNKGKYFLVEYGKNVKAAGDKPITLGNKAFFYVICSFQNIL